MANVSETQAELKALRAMAANEARAARAAEDVTREQQLRNLLGEIDNALDMLVLTNANATAERLVGIRTRLEALKG